MLYFLGGLIAGIAVTLIITKLRTSTAIFRIDHKSFETPVCRLDLNDLDLDNKSRITLKIDHTWVCDQRVGNKG